MVELIGYMIVAIIISLYNLLIAYSLLALVRWKLHGELEEYQDLLMSSQNSDDINKDIGNLTNVINSDYSPIRLIPTIINMLNCIAEISGEKERIISQKKLAEAGGEKTISAIGNQTPDKK